MALEHEQWNPNKASSIREAKMFQVILRILSIDSPLNFFFAFKMARNAFWGYKCILRAPRKYLLLF